MCCYVLETLKFAKFLLLDMCDETIITRRGQRCHYHSEPQAHVDICLAASPPDNCACTHDQMGCGMCHLLRVDTCTDASWQVRWW